MEKYNSISIHYYSSQTDICLFFANDEGGFEGERLWLEMPDTETAERVYDCLCKANPNLIQYSA